MREISLVPIYDRAAGRYVDAEFIEGVTWEEIAEAQARWVPAMRELLAKLERANVPRNQWPEHAHWDWVLKYWHGEAEGQHCFGIRLGDMMQGLMLVKPNVKSKLAARRKVVYIDYIATAPWNSTYDGVQSGRYGQVGQAIIGQAIIRSHRSGFDGRIGLYALPQAVSWYKKLGMTEVPSATRDGLRYFEMTPEVARKYLSEG